MDDAIASHFAPVPNAAPVPIGGLTALRVTDTRDGAAALAIQVQPGLPPRARLLAGRIAAPAPHALMPIDHGPGRAPGGADAYFIICPEPPGPPAAAEARPWQESDILRGLMLPAAAALETFAERGITHRAINPANVFRAGAGEKVVLGPCWAAPPASLQPAAVEPPYAAQCLAAGRGEGSIADDVYALGATMLWCALGGPTHPSVAAWADEEALLRRKLCHGSLAALAGQARLPASLAELLRGMLAEDPEHRPTPAMLLDTEQARSRRVAMRPQVRAQRPLDVGGATAWYGRDLAHLMARTPNAGAALLRNGSVGTWLRRQAGDNQLAARLDEALAKLANDPPFDATKPDHLVVFRGVMALDPLAPLVWRGHAVFPDGIAAALAQASLSNQPAVVTALEEVLAQDITAAWAAGRVPRPDLIRMQQEVRDWRVWLGTKGMAAGLPRVLYGGNALLACASPLLGGRLVARLPELLPALEQAATDADRKRPPIDPHIAAFVAARADATLLADVTKLGGLRTTADRLGVIGLFGKIQQRVGAGPLPRLAAWLLESGLAELEQWRSLATRKRLGQKLADLAGAGQIAPMALLLADGGERTQDRAQAQLAAQRLADIEAALAMLERSTAPRAQRARRTGQEIATGLSLLSLLAGALWVALAG